MTRFGDSPLLGPIHICYPPLNITATSPVQPDWTCSKCGRIWRDWVAGNVARYWTEVQGPSTSGESDD